MIIKDFCTFLENSPTALHAVESAKNHLQGFFELKEEEDWPLKPDGRYFCVREGSLIAFILPSKKISSALILASHTDSPSFKIKPNGEFEKEGMRMLGLEIYGAPLLTSWLNRELGIAGKVLYLDKKGDIKEALVNIKNSPCIIPQVAIHLDREVNEKGLVLNKQEHLAALASLSKDKEYLLPLLKKLLPIKTLLSHDLFLYPLEKPGEFGDLFASYRLDSLASVFTGLQAFSHAKPSSTELRMLALFDQEEIGSGTSTGAQSPFFSHIFERICPSRESLLKIIPNSLSVSIDLGHAVHPNYPEKHDSQHKPILGSGVLIKTHAQKKYATDVKSIKRILEALHDKKIPYAIVSGRNDIPSGSTIGPILASSTGIPTIDIGIGQLSMHSARELIASADLKALYALLKELLSRQLASR